MKKSFALIATTALAVFATPAFAQADDGFTGPWIAGVAGYDINQAGSSVDNDSSFDRDESVEGVVYGAAVGYDYDLGTIVVGAEAELTDSTADVDYGAGTPATFGLGAVEAGRDIYVGARLGYKLAPTTLLYAKGGYTNARYNYIGSDGATDTNVNLDTDGYRVGAGVEQRIGSNAFGRIEYRYSNYSKGELDFETANVADSDRFNIDTDRHQIVVSAGLRF